MKKILLILMLLPVVCMGQTDLFHKSDTIANSDSVYFYLADSIYVGLPIRGNFSYANRVDSVAYSRYRVEIAPSGLQSLESQESITKAQTDLKLQMADLQVRLSNHNKHVQIYLIAVMVWLAIQVTIAIYRFSN